MEALDERWGGGSANVARLDYGGGRRPCMKDGEEGVQMMHD